MLTIRLTRIGKRNQPMYRVVLAEHTKPANGKFIEILGHFDPKSGKAELKKERIEYWLKQGSKVSQTVASMLKKQGVKGDLDVMNKKGRPKPKKGKKGEESTEKTVQPKKEDKKPEEKTEKKEEKPAEKKDEKDKPSEEKK